MNDVEWKEKQKPNLSFALSQPANTTTFLEDTDDPDSAR